MENGGYILGGAALLAVLGGLYAVTRRKKSAASTASDVSPPSATASNDPNGDPIVAPAYSYLDLWSVDDRRALYDLQKELGLDPLKGGLAGVIGHESGGDPAAPNFQSGTPRGGLIQVTVGAALPGYTTPADVWAIRSQSRVQQLKGVVRDFYKRQLGSHGPPADQSAAAMLRRNYLPGLASSPSSTVLGVRSGSVGPGGEKATDSLAGKLTYGTNYAANPGFDPSKRGWFTWEDVDRQAARAEQAALSRGFTRVSGIRVSAPPKAVA